MTSNKDVLEISGHSMVYHREGKGEPVLLVHGITTYSFIWRKIIPLLSMMYDVIAVDLLGCGESDKPLDVSCASKDHAERLHEFVARLGLAKFHFVGHDLGGGMGRLFAVPHPEMLHREVPGSRLVHIATGGHFIQEDEPERIARELITFFRGKHASAG